MKYKVIVILLAALAASGVSAGIKPDCDPKKAARNAAMDASVGVSGRCDAGKVAKDTKEDVVDNAKDSVDVDRDKKNKNHKKHKKNKD